MNFSAVILAAGKSARMGRDKAFLEIAGQTLLARQIQLARATGAVEIFISGRADADYSAFDCRVLKDQFQNAGPLAGIERALDSISTPLLLALAVDLPEMTPEFLRQLFAHGETNSGAIPHVNGQIEPLAAFYPKTAKSLAEDLLRAEKNAVAVFAEQCVQQKLARFVEIQISDAKFFANWNSPADISIVKKENERPQIKNQKYETSFA